MKTRMRSDELELKRAHSFFEHRDCDYFPCHSDLKGPFNCIFCFCPLYPFLCEEHGSPRFIEKEDGVIKDCSGCLFPHRPESYDVILQFLAEGRNGIKGTQGNERS